MSNKQAYSSAASAGVDTHSEVFISEQHTEHEDTSSYDFDVDASGTYAEDEASQNSNLPMTDGNLEDLPTEWMGYFQLSSTRLSQTNELDACVPVAESPPRRRSAGTSASRKFRRADIPFEPVDNNLSDKKETATDSDSGDDDEDEKEQARFVSNASVPNPEPPSHNDDDETEREDQVSRLYRGRVSYKRNVPAGGGLDGLWDDYEYSDGDDPADYGPDSPSPEEIWLFESAVGDEDGVEIVQVPEDPLPGYGIEMLGV